MKGRTEWAGKIRGLAKRSLILPRTAKLLLSSTLSPLPQLYNPSRIAITDAIGYAKFFSRSHDAVIRVCDTAGNIIETQRAVGRRAAATGAWLAAKQRKK
jgi:hypothetical protein